MRYHIKFKFTLSFLFLVLNCALAPYLHAAKQASIAISQMHKPATPRMQSFQELPKCIKATPGQQHDSWRSTIILAQIKDYCQVGKKRMYDYLDDLGIDDEEDKHGTLCVLGATIIGLGYLLWRWYRLAMVLHRPTQAAPQQSQPVQTKCQRYTLNPARAFLLQYRDHRLLPRFSNG